MDKGGSLNKKKKDKKTVNENKEKDKKKERDYNPEDTIKVEKRFILIMK